MEEGPNVIKLLVGLVVGVGVLGGVIYGAYLYSQKYGSKVALPSGKTYVGEENPADSSVNPPTAPGRFTADPSVPWKEHKGVIYSYSFNYPETLNLGRFPDDPNDSVAIIWGNIPAQNNVLLNIEDIADRNAEYVGRPEEFVRNWWRFFSGLKGAKTVEKFTNTSGMVGYRAVYINQGGQTPNVDVFFVIPNDPGKLIHVANGVLDPALFSRLIDSVRYQVKVEEVTVQSTPTPATPAD